MHAQFLKIDVNIIYLPFIFSLSLSLILSFLLYTHLTMALSAFLTDADDINNNSLDGEVNDTIFSLPRLSTKVKSILTFTDSLPISHIYPCLEMMHHISSKVNSNLRKPMDGDHWNNKPDHYMRFVTWHSIFFRSSARKPNLKQKLLGSFEGLIWMWK